MKDDTEFDYFDPLNDGADFSAQEKATSTINSTEGMVKESDQSINSAINDAAQTKETVSRNNEISSEDSTVMSSPSELNTESVIPTDPSTEININLERATEPTNIGQVDSSPRNESVSNASVINNSDLSTSSVNTINQESVSSDLRAISQSNIESTSNLTSNEYGAQSSINLSNKDESVRNTDVSNLDQTMSYPNVSEINNSQITDAVTSNNSTLNDSSSKSLFSSLLEKIGVTNITKALNLPTLGEKSTLEQARANVLELGDTSDLAVKSENFSTNDSSSINMTNDSFRESYGLIDKSSDVQSIMQSMNSINDSNNQKETITNTVDTTRSENTTTDSPRLTDSIQSSSLIESVERSLPEITVSNNRNESSTVVQAQPAKTMETQSVTVNQRGESTASAPPEKRNQTFTEPQREPAQPIVSVDMSSLEQRLKRIEFILLNGLEVTIK